jgi:hypothetical protein
VSAAEALTRMREGTRFASNGKSLLAARRPPTSAPFVIVLGYPDARAPPSSCSTRPGTPVIRVAGNVVSPSQVGRKVCFRRARWGTVVVVMGGTLWRHGATLDAPGVGRAHLANPPPPARAAPDRAVAGPAWWPGRDAPLRAAVRANVGGGVAPRHGSGGAGRPSARGGWCRR